MIGPVPSHRSAHLEGYLLEAPERNLLTLGLLAEYGAAHFRVCVIDGAIAGAVYVGPDGQVVLGGIKHRDAAREIGESLRAHRIRTLIGERMSVGGVLNALGRNGDGTVRTGRLYTVTADDMGPFVTTELRAASDADVPAILEATRAFLDEVGLPPPTEGLEGFVRAQVDQKRTFVIFREGRLVFRVDVVARSRHGAHLDYVYTAPEHRRAGLATLGLGQLARSTLARLPCLAALGPDDDLACTGVVRKVGFGPAEPWRRVDF